MTKKTKVWLAVIAILIIAGIGAGIGIALSGGNGDPKPENGNGNGNEPSPLTLTLNPTSVIIGNYNLTSTVTIGGTATGDITLNTAALPSGVTATLSGTTITIQGTRPTGQHDPAITGTHNIIVTRGDLTQTLGVTLNLTTSWVAISPTIYRYAGFYYNSILNLPNFPLGGVFAYRMQVTGTTPITWSVQNGNLPTGFSFNPITGDVFGMANETGTFNFTVRAENSQGYDTLPIRVTIVDNYRLIAPANFIINSSVFIESGAQFLEGFPQEQTAHRIIVQVNDSATYTFQARHIMLNELNLGLGVNTLVITREVVNATDLFLPSIPVTVEIFFDGTNFFTGSDARLSQIGNFWIAGTSIA